MNAWLRTAIAILAGFLTMVLVVMVGTTLATTLFVTEEISAMGKLTVELPVAYLATNLVLSFLAAVAGGWLASRLDGPGGWRPVAGLAVAVLAMSAAGMRDPASPYGDLPWYAWVVMILGVVGALAGGWSRMRSVTYPTTRNTTDQM